LVYLFPLWHPAKLALEGNSDFSFEEFLFLFRQCHISVIVSKTYHIVKYETLISEMGL
jgi:hypothetical protein